MTEDRPPYQTTLPPRGLGPVPCGECGREIPGLDVRWCCGMSLHEACLDPHVLAHAG